MKHSVRFSCIKGGGPGRLRTYDNPVMSRGLYQLSYGSNRRNMPPFPPFGKKKKTFRREFPERKSSGTLCPAPAGPSASAASIRLAGIGRACPSLRKECFAHGEPHGRALPAPAAAHPLRKSLTDARCLIGASPALSRRAATSATHRQTSPDRSAFHKRPGTRTASDQPGLFSCQAPCSCAVPDQTNLVLRNTQKKRYPGTP